MSTVRKIIACTASLSLLTGGMPLHVQAENTDFDTFLKDTFRQMMEEDYLSMHYTVKDWKAYGIEKPEADFGSYEWEDYEKDAKEYEELLDRLHAFDRESLSEEQKNEYDALEFYARTAVDTNSYPYFDFAFVPTNGVVDIIQTNLSEFRFYTEEDFDDYLNVVDDVDDFLEDCLEITTKQSEKGYFLTDSQLEETLSAIDSYTSKIEDNALIISFNDSVDAFDGLDKNKAAQLKQENRDLIVSEVIPAFNEAAVQLNALKGTRNGGPATADLEGGKEYYAALARAKTGMDADVETLLKTCTDYLNRALNDFVDILSTDDTSFIEEVIEMDSAEEVLSYLKDHMHDVPEMPDVEYVVDYLDPSIASPSVNAYYVIPPVDDPSYNVMKINGDNVSDMSSLYETMAHEGFPGHLYQTVTFQNTSSPTGIRSMTSPIGYTEGWAMYAEDLAWQSSPLSEKAGRFMALNTTLNYVLDAAVDLGVNGLGWSVDDTADYLDEIGFNSAYAQPLYEFVTLQPGVILPYGYGAAEIQNLKYEAQQALGNSFSLLEFNTVLLEGGSRPFRKVEADVHTWLYNGDQPVQVEMNHSNRLYWIVGGGAVVVIVGGVLIFRRKRKGEQA
ncbi:MAG: DUF885 domain-containing protein [Bulleidia sp.]